MTTQRKITLTFLDLNTAKTIGWPLRYFARQLGLWADRTDIEIHNLLQNGFDTTKFQLSTVWFDTLQDKSYLTEFNSSHEAPRLPLLPSAQSKVFRSEFDTNMVVPKTLIDE